MQLLIMTKSRTTTLHFMIIQCLTILVFSDPMFYCPNTNTIPTSDYQKNVDFLLSSLASDSIHSKGFNSSTFGHEPVRVYGSYNCRGDLPRSLCRDCVVAATKSLLGEHKCYNRSMEGFIWYGSNCTVRYSNESFFGKITTDWSMLHYSLGNANVTDEPDIDVDYVVKKLIKLVPKSQPMFREESVSSDDEEGRRFGLAQCSGDIDRQECKRCLEAIGEEVKTCCVGKKQWHVLFPSCLMMYEDHQFYLGDQENKVSSPVPQPEPDPEPKARSKIKEANDSSKTRILISTAVIAFLVVMLLSGFVIYYMHRTGKGGFPSRKDQKVARRVGNADFPTILLSVIREATEDFSPQYKLGQGGFGVVYKGMLPNGKKIAVKRLSKASNQGLGEFKNEVILIAKLQHRNLVRLLGCCVEDGEKLLVYEYMPNSSLDVHLFDSEKRVKLDWKLRLSIINGITKGILYLHEDSRLRVIHRDLKPSNILLDHEMNPKISDFGLARPFRGEHNQANYTGRVMGTYGYMAPEYAKEGLFSIKSDVFSFGVLLLEIINGNKNGGFYFSRYGLSLLEHAWKLWCEGKGLELMDPLLEESCMRSEVLKCIHIGLLCVQEDRAKRPTISNVAVMLASDKLDLPNPTQPAFCTNESAKDGEARNGSQKSSINQVTLSSVVGR